MTSTGTVISPPEERELAKLEATEFLKIARNPNALKRNHRGRKPKEQSRPTFYGPVVAARKSERRYVLCRGCQPWVKFDSIEDLNRHQVAEHGVKITQGASG